MYSVVLVMAFGVATQAPDCHWGGGWGGYYGGGCYGSWGGCYGGGCYGSWGGYYGGYGYGGYASGAGFSNYAVNYAPSRPAATATAKRLSSPDHAVILVHLPADARLTFEGTSTESKTAERRFVSPPLARGRKYTYTLEAEIVRDGRTLTTSQTITVRGGKQSEITLTFPGADVAKR